MTESSDESVEPFAELIARVRAGEPDAIGRLVARYESRVRLTARLLLGPLLRPLLDTADLTQSVHRTLLVRLRKDALAIESPEQLVTLLVTIVRHKIDRQWKKAHRRGSVASDAAEAPTIGAIRAIPSPQPGPDNTAAVNDSVVRLLESLPELDRRLLERRLAGCSTAEVAAELGLDSRVLRARLSRLRKRLRERGILDEWL